MITLNDIRYLLQLAGRLNTVMPLSDPEIAALSQISDKHAAMMQAAQDRMQEEKEHAESNGAEPEPAQEIAE